VTGITKYKVNQAQSGMSSRVRRVFLQGKAAWDLLTFEQSTGKWFFCSEMDFRGKRGLKHLTETSLIALDGLLALCILKAYINRSKE